MDNIVSYVGMKPGENMGRGTYTAHVGMSPETGNINEANYCTVTDTNASFNLLNQRSNDINQPALPEIYTKLTSPKAKQEFETFWKLVQSIKSNPNAHKVDEGIRLITTEPLDLYQFFLELKKIQQNDFTIESFLNRLGITLREAELTKANLTEAVLYKADLSEAKLSEANLTEAVLYKADLSEANLSEANLSEAVLYKADLSGANLYKANLSKANLTEAHLTEANLRRANLQKANLQKANLTKANLSNADLQKAYLSNIIINGKTNFTGTILQNIQCDCIGFQDGQGWITKIEDQEIIRQKFIELGAKDENISFAQAA